MASDNWTEARRYWEEYRHREEGGLPRSDFHQGKFINARIKSGQGKSAKWKIALKKVAEYITGALIIIAWLGVNGYGADYITALVLRPRSAFYGIFFYITVIFLVGIQCRIINRQYRIYKQNKEKKARDF